MSSSNLLKGIFCSVAGALFATTAWASDAHVAPLTAYAKSTVKQWISDATVIAAATAQNAKYARPSPTDIDNTATDWRAPTHTRSTAQVQASPATCPSLLPPPPPGARSARARQVCGLGTPQ